MSAMTRGAWLRDATNIAEAIAVDSPQPMGVELVAEVDGVARELAAALVGLECDRMGVPEHLAWALGALLALYRYVDRHA